jgi:hypothetical protein
MSNIWKEPIFDRTLEDIELAIKKIADWKTSHTHSVDVRVENDSLVMEDEGTAYINSDEFILEDEGVAYVEDDILVLDIDDVYDLKGCLNLTDLNRIEGNIAYLAETMEIFSYSPNIHGKKWNIADLPNRNDMSRIIENIRSLVSSYYSPSSPPSLPTTILSYSDLNAIEENLYLIKELLDCMQSSFKKVGTIKSGSNMFLPIRR